LYYGTSFSYESIVVGQTLNYRLVTIS